MNRRTFFKNLLGAAATVAIAPHLLSQIVEHPYEKPPEQLFTHGEGLWIFRDDKLVAFSKLHGVGFHMTANPIEITTAGSHYRTYMPGLVEVSYEAENLRIIDDSILKMEGETFHLVMKTDFTMESDVIITAWSLSGMIFENGPEDICHAVFHCIGESVMTFEKG